MRSESSGRGETPSRRRINLELRFTQYHLPPLDSALIIGKRAPVGANGISRAFQELSPATFQLIPVDHPVAEAVLVRASDLRKLPQQELVGRLQSHYGYEREQAEKELDRFCNTCHM